MRKGIALGVFGAFILASVSFACFISRALRGILAFINTSVISAYFWSRTLVVFVAFDRTIDAPMFAAEEAGSGVTVEIAFASEGILAAHFFDTNQIVRAILIPFARLWNDWFDAGIRLTDFTIGAVFVAITAIILGLGAFTGFADEISQTIFVALALYRRSVIDAITVFTNFVSQAIVIECAFFALWGFDACFFGTSIVVGAIFFGLTRFVTRILFAGATITDAGSGAIVT